MNRRKILLVDDEEKVIELLKAYLEREGYEVLEAGDGIKALEISRSQAPELVILDLNLPGKDGLEVCRTLRKESSAPIIMVTARDTETDKIVGLELGADDYVTKPFSPREVVARVKAVFRRLEEKNPQKEMVRSGDLVLDLVRHEATYCGQEIRLTPAEFKLLTTLTANPGRVFSRSQLLEHAFGDLYDGYERTIDAHIKNIRKKMGEQSPDNPVSLVTVHGVGYKLEEEK